jgi:cytochrome c553
MFKQLMASCVLLTTAAVATAADADAGKAKVQQVCSKCHEVGDWKGKSATEIQGKIQNVVAGKTKHPKKLDLTDADVANIAAYWASAAN